MKKDPTTYLLLQYLDGQIDDQTFRAGVDEETYLKYKQILNEIERWTPSNESVPFRTETLASKPKRQLQVNWPISQLLAVAAVVALVLATVFWLYPSDPNVHYMADQGQPMTITFPDGSSEVTLFPGSEISWNPEAFNTVQRAVSLQGKGYFSVSPGQPFSVATINGRVEVLGTRFEVNVFGPEWHVSCYEGLVQAAMNNNQKVLIKAGVSYYSHGETWQAPTEIQTNEPAWIEQISKFNDAPLPEVLVELERVFQIEIKSDSVNLNRRYTGSFPHDDLTVALQLVFSPLSINYQLSQNILSLSAD